MIDENYYRNALLTMGRLYKGFGERLLPTDDEVQQVRADTYLEVAEGLTFIVTDNESTE